MKKARALGTIFRLTVLAIAVPAVVIVACANSDHGAPTGGDFTTNPNGGTGAPCADLAERKCGITLRAHDGVADCMEATQVCHGGTWGECGEKGPVTTKSIEMVSLLGGGLHPENLGSPSSCASNPCDPYCGTFVDTPSGTLDAGEDGLVYSLDGGITVPVVGTAVDGGATPDALAHDPFAVKANFDGPCKTDADCNLDQHCVAGTCVSWKPGEFDTTCSAPGDSFGAVKPQLICNFTDPVDHYGEFAGTAVVAQFDKSAAPDHAAMVAIAGYSDYLANPASVTTHVRENGKIKIINAKKCVADLSIPSTDDKTPLDPDGVTPRDSALGYGTAVLRFNDQSTPLLVDLNNDGVPELIAEAGWDYSGGGGWAQFRLMAFSISVDVTGKYTSSFYAGWSDPAGIKGRAWQTTTNASGNYAALVPLGNWDSSGPVAIDLDNDGLTEIVWNGYVFNVQGRLIGLRPDIYALNQWGEREYWGQNSIVGDFDLDGKVEYMERQGLFEAGNLTYTGGVLTSMQWNADPIYKAPYYIGCSTAGAAYTLQTTGPDINQCTACSAGYTYTVSAGVSSCNGCPAGYTKQLVGINAGKCVKSCTAPQTYQSSGVDDGQCVNVSTCPTSATQQYWTDTVPAADSGKCASCAAGVLDVTVASPTYGSCLGCPAGYSKVVGGVNDGKCVQSCTAPKTYQNTGTDDGKCVDISACATTAARTYWTPATPAGFGGTCVACTAAGATLDTAPASPTYGQCLYAAACPAGYFRDVGGVNNGKCVQNCAAPSTYMNSSVDDGKCVNSSTCPTTTYETYWTAAAPAGYGGTCTNCPTTATLDVGAASPTYGKCLSCPSGTAPVPGGTNAGKCYSCAGGGTYVSSGPKDGSCETCATGTYYPTGASCGTCAASYAFNTATGQCDKAGKPSIAASFTPAVFPASTIKAQTVAAPALGALAKTVPPVLPTAPTVTALAKSTPTVKSYVNAATVAGLSKSTPATAASSLAPTVKASDTFNYPSLVPDFNNRDFQAFVDLGDYGGATAKGKPEIVWVSENEVFVMAIDGTPILGWQASFTDSKGVPWYLRPSAPAAGSAFDAFVPTLGGGGGSITIGDYDGDGLPEFGIAGASYYFVFDIDCVSPRSYGGKTGTCVRAGTACDCGACGTNPTNMAVLWCKGTQDQSSFITGSSVFDFNADGAAEVVYGDECWTRVYDGKTGTIYFSANHSSQTKLEEPIVADVNGDGRADLVMTSTRAGEGAPGRGLACPSSCAAGEKYDATGNVCYHCFGGASVSGATAPFTCSDGTTPYTYNLVTDNAQIGGVAQAGWLVDKAFPGLPCTTAADCPTAGMACTSGLCRCTTPTFTPPPGVDAQCGAGFACVDPPAGTAGAGKTCRSLKCTGNGCGVSGVQVWTGPGSGWAKSRPIWNQQAYTPTQINDNGTVKKTSLLTTDETVAWTPTNPRANSFRQQLQTPGTPASAAPSLTLEYPCTADSIPVCNRGSATADPGQIVMGFPGNASKFDGSSDKLIKVTCPPTTVPIKPGECIILNCPGIGKGTLEYMVNPDCSGGVCSTDADCGGAAGSCNLTTHQCAATCKNGLTSTPAAPQCQPGSGRWSFTHGGGPSATICGGTATGASAATFTRTFGPLTCPKGTSLKWGLFSYDTTDPSGTNVTFNFKTGSMADGGTITWGLPVQVSIAGYNPVGSATVANPQVCTAPIGGGFTCPIDLGKAFTSAVPAQRSDQPMLEMDATLNPTSTDAPILNAWNVTYDCVPSE